MIVLQTSIASWWFYIHTYIVLTDLVTPGLYSTHGGNTRVRFNPLANPREPKKWSAWFPNRPESKYLFYSVINKTRSVLHHILHTVNQDIPTYQTFIQLSIHTWPLTRLKSNISRLLNRSDPNFKMACIKQS